MLEVIIMWCFCVHVLQHFRDIILSTADRDQCTRNHNTIDLTNEDIPCSSSAVKKWVSVGRTELTMADKECLSSDGWHNDKHVHAAQQLLKKENPYVGGLQDPVLQMAHSFEIEGGEFVQILHMNNNHWITISSIGCSPGCIKLYNSMQLPIPSSIKQTIAELIHTQRKQITIEHINTQLQQGESECGLFAIAIATALCHGQDPQQMEFA